MSKAYILALALATVSPTVLPIRPRVDCPPSYAVNREVVWNGKSQLFPIIKHAQYLVGDVCGQFPTSSLNALAAQLRNNMFAACRFNDALYLRESDGYTWEEFKVVDPVTGCWTSNGFVIAFRFEP